MNYVKEEMLKKEPELRKRIRSERGLDLLMTADEAAAFIKDGMTLGVSGFTPVDDPKVIPKALLKRTEKGEKIELTVYSGGSQGPIDNELVLAGITKKRLPFIRSVVGRKEVDKGTFEYDDMHLSLVAQYINYGYLNKMDLGICEVVAVTEEGDLIPSVAVGNEPTIVANCDSILLEVNFKKPLGMEGMHDVYTIPNPPVRREIPIYSPSDRIGSPVIKCGWDKIKGIVVSYEENRPHLMTPPDENSIRIAKNVLDFLRREIREGRLSDPLPPLQSGIGNVANALLKELSESELTGLSAFTEVVQDGMLDLIDKGKMNFASATCMTLSADRYKDFFERIDFYNKKILIRPIEITNSPEVVRRLGIISINTAIEADIYGNVNSTHMMGKHIYNGIGGAADFSRNAGLTIFTTPSIAKNGNISCIVPMASHVDHTEHDVMILVTEQGYADLRGLSPKERAREIIDNCVHPDYKEKMEDYFRRACAEAPCQTPHILDEALSWHSRYEKTGSMK